MAQPARKKICLLICNSIPGLQPDKLKDWLAQMPELGIIADIEPIFVFGKNAADVNHDTWSKLADIIFKRLESCAGFVVLHGLDNLLFTTSALSFMLQSLSKPVIFTGSQNISNNSNDSKNLGIKANLINAIQVATSGVGEVGLMFGNRLLRANQATRAYGESLNLFTAPENAVLGRIDFSIRIFERLVYPHSDKVKFFRQLNKKIEVINLSAVIDFDCLKKKLSGRDGVIINTGDYQGLPEDLVYTLSHSAKNMPVIIWSKEIRPSVLSPKNFLIINNMTWHATLVKFMWALSQGKGVAKVKELMAQSISGEIISE